MPRPEGQPLLQLMYAPKLVRESDRFSNTRTNFSHMNPMLKPTGTW
jgi:hypothetical protein